MKCGINGIEVECSVEEFKELQGVIQKNPYVPYKHKERISSSRYKGLLMQAAELVKKGTQRNKALLKTVGYINGILYRSLNKLLTEPSNLLITLPKEEVKDSKKKSKEEKLKKAKQMVEDGMSKGSALKVAFGYATGDLYASLGGLPITKTTKAKDYLSKRQKFIHSRARTLTANNAMDYEEAYRRAATEWQNFKKPNTMPDILPDKEMNKLLIDMIARSIESKEPLHYKLEGVNILLCNNIKEWAEILARVSARKGEISKYLKKNLTIKIIDGLGLSVGEKYEEGNNQ